MVNRHEHSNQHIAGKTGDPFILSRFNTADTRAMPDTFRTSPLFPFDLHAPRSVLFALWVAEGTQSAQEFKRIIDTSGVNCRRPSAIVSA